MVRVLKRTIPQPPLPCKNNSWSHDLHSVRQQGGSDVCGEIVGLKRAPCTCLIQPFA